MLVSVASVDHWEKKEREESLVDQANVVFQGLVDHSETLVHQELMEKMAQEVLLVRTAYLAHLVRLEAEEYPDHKVLLVQKEIVVRRAE